MNRLFQKLVEFFKSTLKDKERYSTSRNPWAGLSSYKDPLNAANPLKFCGREEESLGLFSLIDDNIVVTLYGKSGIGKTSLLNAGVFPLLRENNYAPVYMRFGTDFAEEKIFASHITHVLTKHIKEIYGENSIEIVDVIADDLNAESEDYLWRFFARRRFFNKEGEPIFPVIVLDQFEENIKNQRQQTSLFLRQIAYMSNQHNMLKDTYVNNQYYSYDYNFRFVISIREDDLFRLEDIISINYLSSLKNGRYRLQNLSHKNAKSIVQGIGAPYIKANDIDKITELIINVSKDNEDKCIRTNVISLICARLFDLASKKNKNIILLHDVEDYLSTDPFEEYYTSAVKSLSEGEKRFIETNFVSSDGRRNIVLESQLKDSVKSYDALTNGPTPIFHRMQSVSGEPLIELIHDGICPTVIKNRTIRLEKKNKTILSLSLFIFGFIGLWMLNTAIVNDFVSFFLSLSMRGVKNLGYLDILTLTELLTIIFMPFAIGAIVYDDRTKRQIAFVAVLLFLLPIILYPNTALYKVAQGITQIINNLNNHEGIEEVLNGFSSSACVIIVYSICILSLCGMIFLGKPGIRRNSKIGIKLWNTTSVKIYLWVIAVFLFYKSIFNDGYFIIDSYDSCWGLIAIPLLTLNIFGINLIENKNKWSLGVYVVLLTFLTISSILELFPSVEILIVLLAITFCILSIYFYQKNVVVTCFQSLCNVLVLAIVLMLNMGYNPLKFENHNICKVYPWKIVVNKDDNKFGIFDAKYGDTLLIPHFQKGSNKYYAILPHNNYVDTITGMSVGYTSLPFPLQLTKIGTGDWKLTLMYSPNYESAISRVAHLEESDSTILSNKGGASLFIRLRNDISKFCITGDDYILRSDVRDINNYEEMVKYDLYSSLRLLSDNDSIMTEDVVVHFIKALSRSLYMNMLKESILKGHYNDFIGWFSSYYVATLLTSVTSEKGIGWSNHFKYNWSLSLNSDVNKSFPSTQSNSFSITLEGLNENRVYAWNNLYYALYRLECNAYSSTYGLNMKNKIEDDNLILEEMLKLGNEIHQKLLSYNKLEVQNTNLNSVMAYLTDLKNNKQPLSLEDISKTLATVIETINISNNVKKELPSEMNSFWLGIDSLSSSFKEIELQRADLQFKSIVMKTFNSLMKIIETNPHNAYNGLLISLCQKLYVIGVVRGYNMEEYFEQMSNIEKFAIDPMYNFVKEVDNSFKQRSLMLNKFKQQFNAIKITADQLLKEIK